MLSDSERTKLSKSLSYILRHGATENNIPIDLNGFVDIGAIHRWDRRLTQDVIKEIATKCPKQRFTYNENGTKIAATQGHSVSAVKTENELLTPVYEGVVVHGTFRRNLNAIRTQGLSRMGRNHIHFARSTMTDHGFRRNAEVAIYVDVAACVARGLVFYESKNGVILCSGDKDGFIKPDCFMLVKML